MKNRIIERLSFGYSLFRSATDCVTRQHYSRPTANVDVFSIDVFHKSDSFEHLTLQNLTPQHLVSRQAISHADFCFGEEWGMRINWCTVFGANLCDSAKLPLGTIGVFRGFLFWITIFEDTEFADFFTKSVQCIICVNDITAFNVGMLLYLFITTV